MHLKSKALAWLHVIQNLDFVPTGGIMHATRTLHCIYKVITIVTFQHWDSSEVYLNPDLHLV